MNKLILPRKDKDGLCYLSYSQIAKWLKSKNEYFKSYFFQRAFEGNAYTDFGSKVGEALEDNIYDSFSHKEQEYLKKVPRLDEFEKEIKLQMDGFYVKGFIDTNDKDFKTLIDYKTMGDESKLDGYREENYIQLLIYALAIEQETGSLPDEIKVVGIQRLGNPFKNEELRVGEGLYELPLELSEARLEYAKKVITQTAQEMSSHYKAFCSMMKIY